LYPSAKSQVRNSESGDRLVGIRVFGGEIAETFTIFSYLIMAIWFSREQLFPSFGRSLDLQVNASGLLPILPEQ
jgi:hypothetical protein